MRSLFAFALFLVFASGTVSAQSFGDDNPSGRWLPAPDDFSWPVLAPDAPEFSPEPIRLSQLSGSVREAIASHWPDSELPDSVTVARADLNGDGRPELLLQIPAFGGTGGRYYEIFTPGNRGPRSIGGFQGWAITFRKRKHGWFQIAGTSRGGGGRYTRFLMTFNRKQYEISRNEGHDFNTGTVTIRR